jgi:hypothetical protein
MLKGRCSIFDARFKVGDPALAQLPVLHQRDQDVGAIHVAKSGEVGVKVAPPVSEGASVISPGRQSHPNPARQSKQMLRKEIHADRVRL